MDKFSELKAAAMAATPGRIGDRIDGSGSIKYECTGYDGSLVLRTDHKDMEYGFVGDNADADELFFRLCVPDVVLELLAELEFEKQNNAGVSGMVEDYETKLEAKDKRIAELEAKLATPVQLQNCDFESVAIMAHWCTDEQLKAWVKGVEHAKKQIRAAGFKVEGDA